MWITSPRVPETRPSEHTMVQGILLWKNMFGIKNFDHTCQEPCGPLMWKNHVSNFFFFCTNGDRCWDNSKKFE